MKYWKKRLAAVLALGLCLTLSLPALAADPSEWEPIWRCWAAVRLRGAGP